MELAEQRVSRLVARYAAMLGIEPPAVRFVASGSGPCYEALFHRIELDRRTLALPEPQLCFVVAHEVGHATQRPALLLDFARTVLVVTALVAVPCIMFAAWSQADLWRISIPGALCALAVALMRPIWHARTLSRAIALELDADAKAARVCGARSALQALEAMARSGHIDALRLRAMHEHCAQIKEAESPCR
ncbi:MULTISPECIES: M48 family metalloprotease [unclassified Caballeronia]|uniref:M48 family metalloprotease n=1 Tax=unclassified Caballeronia TaxID=2646786 RepID=UPI00285BAEA9|nr:MULTISPECIES: M48 family metalloprotease [unclassified Caballeronia]MDR5740435.1 M48 family metalloprotease [Caballeronia sp. LZ016]MDR5808388.1 M48 family metalloprotease [Caballeronia sp. LZ019]